MLEITRKNCYKCDLETIFDNNSQYFWVNLKDLEVETECKWFNIFNKHGNKSTLKYRRELTPNINLQADRIFVRNDLFEQVIKSCKSNSIEFLMLKEKLGICLYEELNEKIFEVSNEKSTKDSIEELDKKPIKVIDKVSNNESNKELAKKMCEESNKELNKESNKELIETISLKNDDNTTNWCDENRFYEILTTIDSNNFNHKNKVGKFKFNEINDLINNIKNNTISEANAQKKINELNKIKKVEKKDKLIINSQKTSLSLFNDLKTIFNNNNENNSKNVNENENENESEKDEYYYETKELNNWFKTIDQTKSLEEQIELLKEKREILSDYWYVKYYHENKELNYKIFKAKSACVLNNLNDNSFEKIFDCKFATLVDKLMNTTSKDENQMFINDIKKTKIKFLKNINLISL